MRMSLKTSLLSKALTRGLFAVIAAAVLSSVVVFSCGAHAGSIPTIHHDTYSCQMHNVTSDEESEESVWTAILPGPLKGAALAIAFVAIFFATRHVVVRKLSARIKQRIRFMFWLWSRSRPFISNQNFLPYFAPVRDA